MSRAIWKGRIGIDALSCGVSLHAAASTSERISFHTLNRATGNRVQRRYIDAETEQPVEREAQVKGYETGKDRYVILEPEEIAAAVPDSDKILGVEAFLTCADVDTSYFDKPYFLAPSGPAEREAYELIRDGLRTKGVAALARTVLFRRMRAVLIRPDGPGMVAHTLNFDYEVRPAAEAFDGIADIRIKGEMLDLARHIITTKTGSFDPAGFDDRYDAALAELVKAKSEGRKVKAPKPAKAAKAVDLLEALRQSAGGAPKPTSPDKSGKARAKSGAGGAPARRKAG